MRKGKRVYSKLKCKSDVWIVIEIYFQEKKEKKGFFLEFIRKIKQKKGVCKETPIEKWGQEGIKVELPVCYGEKVRLDKEWFFRCLQDIKKRYSNQLIYIEKDVCRRFGLKPYEKQWICWYVLLMPIWQQLKEQYAFICEKEELILCDTKDQRVYYLFFALVNYVKEIQIITDEPKRWEKICEAYLQEYGMVVDIYENIEGELSGKVIVDLNGQLVKQYSKLEQENVILAFQLSGEQKAYLNCRLKWKRVICGCYQSLEGEVVEEKYIAIYMQSVSWKMRQLANTKEVFLEERELEEFRKMYQWKLEGLEIL